MEAHQDQPGCPPLQPEISTRWGEKKIPGRAKSTIWGDHGERTPQPPLMAQDWREMLRRVRSFSYCKERALRPFRKNKKKSRFILPVGSVPAEAGPQAVLRSVVQILAR